MMFKKLEEFILPLVVLQSQTEKTFSIGIYYTVDAIIIIQQRIVSSISAVYSPHILALYAILSVKRGFETSFKVC